MPERVMLTLYGRVYCHLCTDMETALALLQSELPFELQCIDVDSDESLAERFGDKVPILTVGEKELCHYFLDEAAVRALFRA